MQCHRDGGIVSAPMMITFRAKVREIHDGDVRRRYVPIPVLDRRHCNMDAFRSSRRFGPYANSDFFKGMLARIRKDALHGSPWLYLDSAGPGVNVDTSDFLAKVTITVDEVPA